MCLLRQAWFAFMMSDDTYALLSAWLRSPGGLAVACLWGAIWGSFANVCIHRIPLGQSIVLPASHCPSCKADIAWYDNFPIVSWLLLRGRCRRCQAVIGVRYPLVELVLLLLAAAIYARFVLSEGGPLAIVLSRFVTYFFFATTLVVLSAIDLQTQLLPDRITYPAIPLFFVLGRIYGHTTLTDTALDLVAGYVVVWVIATAYRYLKGREGLGLGDAKLLSLIGGLLGWHALPWTLFFGSVSGLLLALPVLLFRRRGADGALLHAEVPFGPFLSLAALVYTLLFVGRDPLTWLAASLPSFL